MEERLVWLEDFAFGKLLPAAVLGVLGIFLIRLTVIVLSSALHKTKLEHIAIKLVRSLLRTVLYILLFLAVFSALGVDVTGVVALASVLTLAISLSLQNALTNLFGGLTLLYTKPFIAGDYVEIAEQSGTVSDIGLTYTRLTTPDNKIISIPNNSVVSAQIVNYSAGKTRRLDLVVFCDHTVPAAQVIAALLRCTDHRKILPEPSPFAGARSYKDGTIEYVLQVWTDAEDYWPTLYALNHTIQTEFAEQKIPFSYPHLNLHLDKDLP